MDENRINQVLMQPSERSTDRQNERLRYTSSREVKFAEKLGSEVRFSIPSMTSVVQKRYLF